MNHYINNRGVSLFILRGACPPPPQEKVLSRAEASPPLIENLALNLRNNSVIRQFYHKQRPLQKREKQHYNNVIESEAKQSHAPLWRTFRDYFGASPLVMTASS